jgi:hypothetical protein
MYPHLRTHTLIQKAKLDTGGEKLSHRIRLPALGVLPDAIRTGILYYRKNILRKLNLENSVQLVNCLHLFH